MRKSCLVYQQYASMAKVNEINEIYILGLAIMWRDFDFEAHNDAWQYIHH